MPDTMGKSKIFRTYLFSLSLIVFFLSGCVYITHLDEALFLKGLEDNQKQMRAQMEREERLYAKLKADILGNKLKALTSKHKIIRDYGEPTLCKPAEGQGIIKETCFYRKQAGGLLTEVISLNFDEQARLYSWDAPGSGK